MISCESCEWTCLEWNKLWTLMRSLLIEQDIAFLKLKIFDRSSPSLMKLSGIISKHSSSNNDNEFSELLTNYRYELALIGNDIEIPVLFRLPFACLKSNLSVWGSYQRREKSVAIFSALEQPQNLIFPTNLIHLFVGVFNVSLSFMNITHALLRFTSHYRFKVDSNRTRLQRRILIFFPTTE